MTEDFWPQGNFVAQALGMPSFPRVQLPHPLAGTGTAHLRSVAEAMAAQIIGGLKND
ncbi:MAG: hypothetical protein P8N67_07155 [Pseudomonadales bacterium]|nr:hypothetical protein [Pseudomonadales bacterium]